MRPKLFKNTIALALAVSCGATAAAPALACGGEWYPMVQIDPRIRGVDKAEDALDDGSEAMRRARVVADGPVGDQGWHADAVSRLHTR
jgi:hypothetical protein